MKDVNRVLEDGTWEYLLESTCMHICAHSSLKCPPVYVCAHEYTHMHTHKYELMYVTFMTQDFKKENNKTINNFLDFPSIFLFSLL